MGEPVKSVVPHDGFPYGIMPYLKLNGKPQDPSPIRLVAMSLPDMFRQFPDVPDGARHFLLPRWLRRKYRQGEQFLRPFKLGDLVEAGAGESGAGGGDEGAVRRIPVGVPQGSAQVPGVGAAVFPLDVRIGGGLIVPACGDQDRVGFGDARAEAADGSEDVGRFHEVRKETGPDPGAVGLVDYWN